jgi:adenylate cyclase class 2
MVLEEYQSFSTMEAPIEVELKIPLSSTDDVVVRAEVLGAIFGPVRQQIDTYFRHPCRDFAVTDEALRLRAESDGCSLSYNSLTYKGPKLDATTKTRREIELPLGASAQTASTLEAILIELGFQPIAQVVKHRRTATVNWHGRTATIALDEVRNLGAFVEVELVAQPQEVELVRGLLLQLVDALSLRGLPTERRSYLELILAGR